MSWNRLIVKKDALGTLRPSSTHSLSRCRNHLAGFVPPNPPYYGMKQIQATVTCDMDDVGTFIATIGKNQAAILALLSYNGSGLNLGASASLYIYNFDANPAFDITKGNVYFGVVNPLGGPFISSIQSTGFNEGIGDYDAATGWYDQGWLSQAQAKTAASGSTKQLLWTFVYNPLARPGSGRPLYTNDGTLAAYGIPGANPFTTADLAAINKRKTGNIVSQKPEADLNTRLVGSVFYIPILPFKLNYSQFIDKNVLSDPAAPAPPQTIYLPNFGGQSWIYDGLPNTPYTIDTTDSGGAGGTGTGLGHPGGLGAGGSPGGAGGGGGQML